MSALPDGELFKVGRAVTAAEWAELRRTSLFGLPDALAGLDPDSILLAYQKRAIRARLLHTVTFIEKSRRTGLTWAFASDAVLVSASEHAAGGMDSWYIGYNLEMAREFIDVCGMWAKLFGKAASEIDDEYIFEDFDPETGETREIKAFRITFASGFAIVALPSSPRSLRGKQGYVLIDEAAFHDNLEALLKAAMALTIWGGMIVVISTHDGEQNAFNQKIKEIRSGQKRYGLVRIDFDEALREGLYQRICLRKGAEWSPEAEAEWRQGVIDDYGDGADEELFCIPAEGSGAWILPAVIEKCMSKDIPVFRWEMPASFAAASEFDRTLAARMWCETNLVEAIETLDKELLSYVGEDFGRVADLTVLWPLQITKTLFRRTPFIVEMRNIPFQQQEQVVFWVCDRLPRFQGGVFDAGGNGAALAEAVAQKYGMERILQLKFSADWYRDNMPKFKATLEAEGMSLPRHADIAGDFQLIKMIDGIARPSSIRSTEKGEAAADGKKKKRHADAAIAAALAHFASFQPIKLYEYRSAAPTQMGHNGGPPLDDNKRNPYRQPLGVRIRGSMF
ncbi:hypothetical protein BA190_27600 [Labrys sp. WJW]|uniref:hypothetical protein n=1 Tax=Labrys sp. WJW TaxID=1737983 RepID=UPI000833F92E|nr:hypothetical protein [Labrys sp. WJW]OCC01729.1 hypothetical protein BA190_27600 [Labrys sp. WJW]